MEKRERIEKIENNDVGSIRIADEAVGIIAGMAATVLWCSRHERRLSWWHCRNAW